MNYIPFLKIIRPINCLFAMFTTFFGAWYLMGISETSIFLLFSFFACISTFFIAAGGYAINDFFDFEIDKVNKPDRPLPKGDVSLLNAKIYSIILFGIGLITAVLTYNIYCVAIACFNIVSLYFYGLRFKKSFLFGNIIVAWNSCSTFIYGALISSNIKNILPLAYFSFFYTIIREWVKTIEDLEGDIKEKVKSVAAVLGKKNTVKLLFIPTFFLITPIFVFLNLGIINNIQWLILNLVITLPIIILLIMLKISLKLNHDIFLKNISKIQKIMKFNMLLIVLIFVINDIISIRI